MLIVIVPILIFLIYSYRKLLIKKKLLLEKSQANEISKLIVSYFDNNELDVKVLTFMPPWADNFMTLIETPPISRFRNSSILEVNLIDYVEKVTGKAVTKIYWRFSLDTSLAKDKNSIEKFVESYRSPESEKFPITNFSDDLYNPQIILENYVVLEISLEAYENYAT